MGWVFWWIVFLRIETDFKTGGKGSCQSINQSIGKTTLQGIRQWLETVSRGQSINRWFQLIKRSFSEAFVLTASPILDLALRSFPSTQDSKSVPQSGIDDGNVRHVSKTLVLISKSMESQYIVRLIDWLIDWRMMSFFLLVVLIGTPDSAGGASQIWNLLQWWLRLFEAPTRS